MQNDILNKEEALKLYRQLVLARLCEEKIREEYHKDEMKTPVHLGIGGEAIPVGVCHCLPTGTKTFGTYRNHSLYLAVAENTDQFFGEMYGKMTGVAKGKAGSMHLSSPENGFIATSAVVGTTIPVAVGWALANSYRQSKEIVTVFFGDGAVEEGVFWESLNFASLRKLRILFVCEDNGLAIHTPTKERQGFLSLEKVVEAFDCHSAFSAGDDLLNVVASTRQVLNQIFELPKPGFLRFTYHRYLEHVGPKEDYDAGYRLKPFVKVLEERDPVIRFEKFLAQHGLNELEFERIKKKVRLQIDQSVEAAQKAPFPSSLELQTDIFV